MIERLMDQIVSGLNRLRWTKMEPDVDGQLKLDCRWSNMKQMKMEQDEVDLIQTEADGCFLPDG